MTNKESKEKKKEIKIDDNCIFSNENVNLGHQPEFDYVKAVSILCMTLDHTFIHYNGGYLFTAVEFVTNYLSAGSFMLLMGIGMKYTRNHDPNKYLVRGIVLLTMGQYFYLIRNCLPNLIAWWATGNKKFLSRSLLVLQTDILTFAGLAYLLIGLLKKFIISDKSILLISIIMNCASFPIYKLMKQPNNYLLSIFLGYFTVTKAEALFSLLGHFIYVAFGNWIGGFYTKIKNKDKFHNRILIFCAPIDFIFHYFRMKNKIPLVSEYASIVYYYISPGPDAIHRIMNIMVSISISYKIHKMLGKTPYIIYHFGKNLNQYYIITYVITMQFNTFLKATRGDKFTSEFKYTDLLGFFILFSAYFLIELNDKYIHFTITTLKNSNRNIVFAFIWIITIICVIYIYPKVDVYANGWNYYLYET